MQGKRWWNKFYYANLHCRKLLHDLFPGLFSLVQTEECLEKKMKNPAERSELRRTFSQYRSQIFFFLLHSGPIVWIDLMLLPSQSRRRRPSSCTWAELGSPKTWTTRSPSGWGPWIWSARTSYRSPAAFNRPPEVGLAELPLYSNDWLVVT